MLNKGLGGKIRDNGNQGRWVEDGDIECKGQGDNETKIETMEIKENETKIET